jgi:hypothetical protein
MCQWRPVFEVVAGRTRERELIKVKLDVTNHFGNGNCVFARADYTMFGVV